MRHTCIACLPMLGGLIGYFIVGPMVEYLVERKVRAASKAQAASTPSDV